MSQEHNAYWSRTRRFTLGLTLFGLVTTFCCIFFARELADLRLFDWPLPFYMASQGLILLYLGIVAVYALYMRHLDKSIKTGAGDGQ